jgi:hypothetical protein
MVLCTCTHVLSMGLFWLCFARAFTLRTVVPPLIRLFHVDGFVLYGGGTTACLASLFHFGVISYTHLRQVTLTSSY